MTSRILKLELYAGLVIVMVTDAKRYLIELRPLASVDSIAYDLLYFYLGRL